MISGKENTVVVDENLFLFSEVDSHRNFLGSNEKKMLSSLTLLLENITSNVFSSSLTDLAGNVFIWLFLQWRLSLSLFLALVIKCLLLLLLIIQIFFLFSLGGGRSVQGAMLIWPRIVCGSTVCSFAHLVVCIFPSGLGAGIWQCGSPPVFSI
jgi:hypothetical protein